MADDYLKPMIDLYDSIAPEYALNTAQHAPKPQRDEFVRLVRSGGKILDAGCGPGRDVQYFSDLGYEVVGVDLSKRMLDVAKGVAPRAQFYCQDLRNLQFPDASFDGIWACTSIIHLKRVEIPGVLRKFYDLLAPEGVLFVHAQRGEGEIEKVEPSIPNAVRRYTLFSESEMKGLLETAGFSVLDIFESSFSKAYESGKTSMPRVSCFARKK